MRGLGCVQSRTEGRTVLHRLADKKFLREANLVCERLVEELGRRPESVRPAAVA